MLWIHLESGSPAVQCHIIVSLDALDTAVNATNPNADNHGADDSNNDEEDCEKAAHCVGAGWSSVLGLQGIEDHTT